MTPMFNYMTDKQLMVIGKIMKIGFAILTLLLLIWKAQMNMGLF